MKSLFWAIIGWFSFCLSTLGSGTPVPPGEDFNADAHAAAATLQQWYNRNGLWDTTGWWNAANCLEALELVIEADNGGQYLSVLPYTFELNATNHFLNEYYDDEGWWALAWVRAYDLTGDERYLQMAKTIFQDMIGGWTSDCDGGLQWRKSRGYKNAIPNELFLLVAVRLHQRTPGDGGPGSHLEWALKEWIWFEQTGMLNALNLVNDGLDRFCQNNGRTTWTYNQGVILGGLTDLYKVTGNSNYLNRAIAIADAATLMLVDDHGILREPCEGRGCHGGDVPQFKGIFIRYLAYLYDETHKPEYLQFLLRNAHSVWLNDRNAGNQLGLAWTGPFDFPDAARQSSALTALAVVAAPTTTNASFAPGAKSARSSHRLGTPSGSLAWTADNLVHDCGRPDAFNCWEADPVRDTVSAYLARGPGCDALGRGKYLAKFELKVDNFNWDDSKVARLSVADAQSGAVLAAREITRRQFANTLYHTFALPFKARSGKRYDFRTYWFYAPHAPRLTERSVIVTP